MSLIKLNKYYGYNFCYPLKKNVCYYFKKDIFSIFIRYGENYFVLQKVFLIRQPIEGENGFENTYKYA